MAIPDLVRDSKLETYYLPDCTVETVHRYHEPDPKSRRRLVTREEHWRRGKKVGRGAYGSVWLERCTQGARSDRKIRAVKQIDISGRFGAIDYNRELEAIAKFSQSRYERCFVKSLGWYDSPEYLFIAMEYLEVGDLSEYLRKMPPLPEAQAQEITYQILDGLNMMHDNDFAHRDLKPNNILIQSHPPDEWWIKISDFGISKRVEEAPGASTTLRGTSDYIAPELYGLIERGTPFASDIWALGQIVFQLLTNEMAFEDLGALFKYATQANQFPTGRLSKFSALGVEFITSLMCPIPKDRMTAPVAISHTWIESKPDPSDYEPNISPCTQDVATITSMTETFASWNTNSSYPAPEIVDDAPSNKINFHGVDIRLWRTFRIRDVSDVNRMIAFSPNGESLVIPSGIHARIWNTSDGTEVRPSILQNEDIRVAAFSPDGKYIATGGTRLTTWNVPQGLKHPHHHLNGKQNAQYVAFSPDSSFVACSSTTKIEVWNIQSEKKLFTFRHAAARRVPLAFAPVGKRLIYYTSRDSRVWTKDLITGDLFISAIPPALPKWGTPNFSPDGRYLAFSYGSGICVLDMTKTTPKVASPVVRTKFFGLYSHEVNVVDVESPNHWFEVELNCHKVGPLAFSPSGNVLATCVYPRENPSGKGTWTIVLWDVVESGNGTFKLKEIHRVGEFPGGYVYDDHRYLVFSPDGNLLACSSLNDRRVRVWRADTRKEMPND